VVVAIKQLAAWLYASTQHLTGAAADAGSAGATEVFGRPAKPLEMDYIFVGIPRFRDPSPAPPRSRHFFRKPISMRTHRSTRKIARLVLVTPGGRALEPGRLLAD